MLNLDEFVNGGIANIKTYKIESLDDIKNLNNILLDNSNTIFIYKDIHIIQEYGIVLISLHNVDDNFGFK